MDRETVSASTLAPMSELWLPGGPSADDFVARLHQQISRFGATHALAQTMVEVEIRDGARLVLDSISAEPGYGFVTLRPHPQDDGELEELIVPLASIAQIRLSPAEKEAKFGFALPDEVS
jgi:hypothetical protein